MTNDPIVRELRPGDDVVLMPMARRLLVGLLAWRDEAQAWKAIESTLGALLRDPGGSAVFVAEQGGRIAGAVTVSERRHFTGVRQAAIEDLFVAESLEGTGIGRLLLERAEEWARASGLGALSVETGARNERALRLYRRAGFEDEDVRLSKNLGR